VTETPCLRPDGSVLDKPGYDKATELVFIPNDDELTRAQGQAGP